jgi:hypothetical protein
MARSADYIASDGTQCQISTRKVDTMKSLLLVLVFVSTSVAFAADSTSISGKWKVHTSVSGNESDMSCTITQKEAQLSGTCKADGPEGNLAGEVDGKKITWTYNSEYNGSPITCKYSGTFDSATNTITGTLTVEEFSVDGDFTASPQK